MASNTSQLALFMFRLKAPDTRRQYPARLKRFMDFCNITGSDLEQQCENFVSLTSQSQKYAFESPVDFLNFLNQKARHKEITHGTVKNYYKAVKSFCDMNSINLNWKLLSSGLLPSRKSANDRAPTVEEIRRLVEYPDPRIKSIVFMMASGGFRVGAWDWLQLKHVIPQFDKNTCDIIAAKLIIYAEEPDEYFTFISPEAFNVLQSWMDYRQSYDKRIGPDSWLMRDLWQTTNTKWGARWGLASIPKKLYSEAIRRLLERALQDTGLRKPLPAGVKRHPFKAAHGFRKFYDTQARASKMLDNIVELTMGHSLGVAQNYDRFEFDVMLREYLKVVPSVAIRDDSTILSKQLDDLKYARENDSSMLRSKLEEKDNQIAFLDKKMDELRSEVDWYLDTLKVAKKIVARSPDGRIDDEGRSILDDKRRFSVSNVDDSGKRKTVKVPIDNVEIFD